MSNILCYICYEDVEPLDCNGTLWAPCCKKNAWFHRKCVQVGIAFFYKYAMLLKKKKIEPFNYVNL
jgi:hypothetical protein